MNRTVTHVDEQGNILGEVDIMDAHTGEGKLHRAFSVYVFNKDKTKLMIQKRSDVKMLWAGFWANTCCSHPFPGESAIDAGQRRLNEELGFTCPLTEGETFIYRAIEPRGKGLEHEYDAVLIGTVDESIDVKPNPKEVSEWKWIAIEEMQKELKNNPDLYTPWFHISLSKALS